jgi:beta-lactamase class D
VEGCFVLYDKKENKFIRYNAKRCAKRFTPASTFKIPNTLIALETGVIKDEDEILKWDGVKRDRAEWNRDHTLDSAFEYSAVWFYQEIARRVGEERMKKYLNDFAYGNRNTSGGIDLFWLRGNLRISPDEQITFLRKVSENKLPISVRSIEILKKIMLTENNANYKLFAKTGAGRDGEKRVGWYVGFIEQNGNVYYFASNIEAENTNENFMPARVEIAKKILNELGLLKEKEKL